MLTAFVSLPVRIWVRTRSRPGALLTVTLTVLVLKKRGISFSITSIPIPLHVVVSPAIHARHGMMLKIMDACLLM